ncbi:MAG: ATP-binding protein [Nannocystis sp.]|uniref:AAA family ATPase n=1 Tax=Nannocystis sp. TaxID=1962667 RepID=UPI0024276676|nr:ATP-binding protein [Nannocystis sp.]MBK9757632.1 ATP-binding protein [Nannocystis sp.]
MQDLDESAAQEPASDRIVAVTVEDPALGGLLRLTLEARRTVLVGKNGAGKSRLLEDLHAAALAATRLGTRGRPERVKFEVQLGGVPLDYSYVCTRAPERTEDPDDRMSWYWNERCIDAATGRRLWQVGEGIATIGDDQPVAMIPIHGLLHLRSSSAFTFPSEVDPLRALLRGVRLIRAGVPRQATAREPVRLQRVRDGVGQAGSPWTGRGDDRLLDVVKTLVSWFEVRRDQFDAVVEVGRRLQVLQEIDVTLEAHPHPPAEQEAELFVDGVNFGLLSDGTQRIVELVIKLVDPAVTVLLLEEPETSVHPGLLGRVLAELDAFDPGRQVVISTHSLGVVDAAAAGDIRVVERSAAGTTSVRPLNADEQQRLRIYLDDGLELADFLFSGALD